MSDAQARATLAIMEVVGKMMIGLADTGALPKAFLREAAAKAAERLEPTEDDEHLKMMAGQWRATAGFFESPRTTN